MMRCVGSTLALTREPSGVDNLSNAGRGSGRLLAELVGCVGLSGNLGDCPIGIDVKTNSTTRRLTNRAGGREGIRPKDPSVQLARMCSCTLLAESRCAVRAGSAVGEAFVPPLAAVGVFGTQHTAVQEHVDAAQVGPDDQDPLGYACRPETMVTVPTGRRPDLDLRAARDCGRRRARSSSQPWHGDLVIMPNKQIENATHRGRYMERKFTGRRGIWLAILE